MRHRRTSAAIRRLPIVLLIDMFLLVAVVVVVLVFVVVVIVLVGILGGDGATGCLLLNHFIVAQARVAVLGAGRADGALAGAPRLSLATGQASGKRELARMRRGGSYSFGDALAAQDGRHISQERQRRLKGKGNRRGLDMTHAALILRLFEGGWPWLWTKRICLGAGVAPLTMEVMAREVTEPQQRRSMMLRCGRRSRATGGGGTCVAWPSFQQPGATAAATTATTGNRPQAKSQQPEKGSDLRPVSSFSPVFFSAVLLVFSNLSKLSPVFPGRFRFPVRSGPGLLAWSGLVEMAGGSWVTHTGNGTLGIRDSS